jgi:hypothetical protein
MSEYGADETEPDIYEVEAIVAEEIRDGRIYYQVRWAGWPPDCDTFEPPEHLTNCAQAMSEWQKRKKLPKEGDELGSDFNDITVEQP